MSGCGVDMHDDECLCDVVITDPTPIVVTDAVNDMWMGAEVCKVRGYGIPWTPDTMLEYFSDLCTFYDRWSELQSQKGANTNNGPHQRMVQLLKQGVAGKDIRRIIYKEFGVEYSRAAVSKCKSRLGLIP